MNELWKGYCIIEELKERKIITSMEYKFQNSLIICDYKTLKKMQEGEEVSDTSYEACFNALQIIYHQETSLDEWLVEKAIQIVRAYEILQCEQVAHLYEEIIRCLEKKPYPYQLLLKIIKVMKEIMVDNRSVSKEKITLLYPLLKESIQEIKTLGSICIYWNKRRENNSEESLYELVKDLPFVEDLSGLRIKILACNALNKREACERYLEKYKCLIHKVSNNENLLIQYYKLMEGYYFDHPQKELRYLMKVEELNNTYHFKLGKNNYNVNCYYLAISFYWIGKYEKAYTYIIQVLENEEVISINDSIIYFAICSALDRKPTHIKIEDISTKGYKGEYKMILQLYKYRFLRRGNKELLIFINERFLPTVTSNDGIEIKLINEELKRLNMEEVTI